MSFFSYVLKTISIPRLRRTQITKYHVPQRNPYWFCNRSQCGMKHYEMYWCSRDGYGHPAILRNVGYFLLVQCFILASAHYFVMTTGKRILWTQCRAIYYHGTYRTWTNACHKTYTDARLGHVDGMCQESSQSHIRDSVIEGNSHHITLMA